MTQARYVMIGGFLGAGKTTAIGRLAERYQRRGLRVGLITNDQSSGLVDTQMLRSHGYDVEEIEGGCFCCRFASLRDAAERLRDNTRPDVFLAEPVGSCTDLVATVSYPLRRIYGDDYSIAPLSVLLDPHRAARVLGLRTGRSFSEKVLYVYRKQMEEASYLVVNKVDEIDATLRDELDHALLEHYPTAQRFAISARDGVGLDAWFAAIDAIDQPQGASMAIDYDLYAEGEALLGWFNATYRLTASRPIDGNDFVTRFAAVVASSLGEQEIEVAHLKMTLDGGDPLGALAAVSIVRDEPRGELREELPELISDGGLIVNLRAEADPDDLARVVTSTIERCSTSDVTLTREHQESFRPGRPVPTHRMTHGS